LKAFGALKSAEAPPAWNTMTQQPVPFLDLVTPHRELEDELVAAFREALRSAAFIGGPQVEGFEREFAAYCGTRFCVGVANGTDAVRFALMAAGVGRGDAVVTVAHTFIATVEAISQAGAETEFVDIDERTYCMSPHALADYLESCARDPKTRRPLGRRSGKPITAVVPVHLYGQVADMDPILDIARHYALLVVEDACQAQGAEYRSAEFGWRRAGSFGKAGAFSFYPGKNLGACGEAGAVTTDDEHVARTIRMLREHGQAKKYYHDLEGYNGRLDAIQAAFLRIKLRHLDAWNAQRKSAAARYGELLDGMPGIVAPFEPETSKAIYHLYVIRTKDRDALADHLKVNGIFTGLHYPLPVHLQNCHGGWGYQRGSLPLTERIASEVLSLPMFPGLAAEQQQRVAAGLTCLSRTRAANPRPKASHPLSQVGDLETLRCREESRRFFEGLNR
jgi:dTDP-4-amino-4,6-dideoxygalactose transaminase